MANSFAEFFGFPKLQAPENSRPKFKPKMVGIPLQLHFFEPNSFSHRACGRDQFLHLRPWTIFNFSTFFPIFGFWFPFCTKPPDLIISQNSFVLVFMGYRTILVQYAAKMGIAQMCLCETKCQRVVSHHFWGVPTSLQDIERYGVSQR